MLATLPESEIQEPDVVDETTSRSLAPRVCEMYVRVGLLPPRWKPCEREAAWVVYVVDGGCGHIGHRSVLFCEQCWDDRTKRGFWPIACGRCPLHVRVLHAERIT